MGTLITILIIFSGLFYFVPPKKNEYFQVFAGQGWDIPGVGTAIAIRHGRDQDG
jgi:hypothetical protein